MDRTVERIGRGRVKSGPIRIGKTRILTSGKRGQNAFRNLIRAASGTKALRTFSYKLTVREGKRTVERPRKVVPDLRRVRRKRGENDAALRERIERIVMRDVQKELFQNVSDSAGRAHTRVVTTRAGVKRRLTRYASGKAVTFAVEIFAEV